MNKQLILDTIKKLGVVAVIRGPSPELTVKMVDALIAGGITGIEVTYSTPNAEQVVAELARKYDDKIVLGMGTLTDPAQALTAKAAGASYLVSPICEVELVKAMVASDLVVMAGAFTPTEVFQAYKLGADVIKIFPGSLAGPAYVKALRGPFPYIQFMPTGGVSVANLGEWFSAGVIAVGAGSELCPPSLAKEGKFDEISARAENFAKAIIAARGK